MLIGQMQNSQEAQCRRNVSVLAVVCFVNVLVSQFSLFVFSLRVILFDFDVFEHFKHELSNLFLCLSNDHLVAFGLTHFVLNEGNIRTDIVRIFKSILLLNYIFCHFIR